MARKRITLVAALLCMCMVALALSACAKAEGATSAGQGGQTITFSNGMHANITLISVKSSTDASYASDQTNSVNVALDAKLTLGYKKATAEAGADASEILYDVSVKLSDGREYDVRKIKLDDIAKANNIVLMEEDGLAFFCYTPEGSADRVSGLDDQKRVRGTQTDAEKKAAEAAAKAKAEEEAKAKAKAEEEAKAKAEEEAKAKAKESENANSSSGNGSSGSSSGSSSYSGGSGYDYDPTPSGGGSESTPEPSTDPEPSSGGGSSEEPSSGPVMIA